VATTVALVRAQRHERMTGLVNAVMRKLANEGAAIVAAQDPARLNCADWLWQSWAATYGEDVAAQIALAHLGEPPTDLTIKSAADAETWAQRTEATILRTGTLRRYGTGRVPDIDGFKDGAWWVQDAAAALPARILIHHLKDSGAKNVVDLCAAPGGKSAQLAAAGYRVTSVDLAEDRIALLRDNFVRLKLYADIVAADALTWRPAAPADAVLLDAPCSATGTIRRHPDLPFLKQPGDIAGFALNQRRLLAAAADMVKPGGLILYSVCSLQPEEGDAVVNAVLADNANLTRVPIDAAAVADASELLTPNGTLRTLPCHWSAQGGMDGFFGALLRKTDGAKPQRATQLSFADLL
jgi:16S rRNA (cytosine967-C5)-methyltransferase